MACEIESFVNKLAGRGSLSTSELDHECIDDLIAYGFKYQSELNTVSVPEGLNLLEKDEILRHMSAQAQSWLSRIEITPCTQSTHSLLIDRAKNESIEGHVQLAEMQTQGRGRRGRRWVSPYARNVMLSIGLVVDVPVSSVGTISLVIGVAVANTLESLRVPSVQLKWPNDIYITGKKLGGILIDLLQPTRPAKLVLGIGLNVEVAPKDIDASGVPAIALSDVVGEINRNQLVGVLLSELISSARLFEDVGFGGFIDDWQRRDALAGVAVEVQGANEKIVGLSQGIDRSGALCIETETGVQRVVGGDVSVRRS